MKKEYKKPIVEVITFCNSENILFSASRPEKPVHIKVDGQEVENLWGGTKSDDWEVD